MLTCLVVDDDRGQRMLTRLLVEDCGGFRVIGEAPDGRQAIAMAGLHGPDVILLDLNMPRMTGMQALPGLRKASPRSTIYVFSSVRDVARLRAAEAAGAHGCIDKMLPNDRLGAELVRLRQRVLARAGIAPPAP